MRGHNISFCSEKRKIIFELASIPPRIWSSGSKNQCLGLKSFSVPVQKDSVVSVAFMFAPGMSH